MSLHKSTRDDDCWAYDYGSSDDVIVLMYAAGQ